MQLPCIHSLGFLFASGVSLCLGLLGVVCRKMEYWLLLGNWAAVKPPPGSRLELFQDVVWQSGDAHLGLHTTACVHYWINVPNIKRDCIHLQWKWCVSSWHLECWTSRFFSLKYLKCCGVSCNPVKREHILLIMFKIVTRILFCSYVGKADYCYTKDEFDLFLTHLPKFSFIWLLLLSEDLDSFLFFEELTFWHELQLLRASRCYNWSYSWDKNEIEKTWNGIMDEYPWWFPSPKGHAVSALCCTVSCSRSSITSPIFYHPLWTSFAAVQ